MTAAPSHIVVLRALKLGDLLCTVPAFRALRRAFPGAEISLLGLPWASAFVARYSCYLDHFIHFPGYPGLPEQAATETDFFRFLEKMRSSGTDLLLQLQGNGTIVNDLMEALRPATLAGFCPPGCSRQQQKNFLPYPDHLHEIHRHLALLNRLDIPSAGDALEFPLTEADFTDFSNLDFPFSRHRYICIHAGSADPLRRWPLAHFAALADHLYEQGLRIVLTGSAAEHPLTRELRDRMLHPAYDMAGRTTLGTLAILLKHARGLLTNCTGVSHLAAALAVPSVVISMDGAPHRWAPLNTRLHRTIDWTRNPDYEWVKAAATCLFRA